MSKKRFSIHQLVGNDDILLWKLGTFCLSLVEPTLYGSKRSVLKQEQHEHRQKLLRTTIDLFQEVHISKDEVLAAWNEGESEVTR